MCKFVKDSEKDLHHWIRNAESEICVQCPTCSKVGEPTKACKKKHGDCKREECIHYISEDSIRKQCKVWCQESDLVDLEIKRSKIWPWFEVGLAFCLYHTSSTLNKAYLTGRGTIQGRYCLRPCCH